MNESETTQRIAELIKRRRESPQFEGRRSLDKKTGEVVQIIGYNIDGVIVERIDLPNFRGEAAASERAKILSDQWTASQIVPLVNEPAQTQRIATLEKHLLKLWEEYDDRRSQFGDNYLWEKHEDTEAIEEIEAFVAKIQEA
jgi:hypothetical protein